MNQAGEDKPAWVAVASNGFGGLQQVVGLGEVGIGIAVVHQGVQILGGFPDAFLAALERKVLGAPGTDELDRLAGMILAIEVGHSGGGIGGVVAEFVFGFSRTVAGGDKIVPLVEALCHGEVPSDIHHSTLEIGRIRGMLF